MKARRERRIKARGSGGRGVGDLNFGPGDLLDEANGAALAPYYQAHVLRRQLPVCPRQCVPRCSRVCCTCASAARVCSNASYSLSLSLFLSLAHTILENKRRAWGQTEEREMGQQGHRRELQRAKDMRQREHGGSRHYRHKHGGSRHYRRKHGGSRNYKRTPHTRH